MSSLLQTAGSMFVGLSLSLFLGQAFVPNAAYAASACVDPVDLSAEFAKTQSGLEFRVLRESSKDSLRAQVNPQQFTVHAAGCLLDGTKFWSTSEPIIVSLDQVIDGWREGLALMSPGDVFVFRIPPHLAYGEEGYPPSIPPQATLVFRIELVEVSVEKDARSK